MRVAFPFGDAPDHTTEDLEASSTLYRVRDCVPRIHLRELKELLRSLADLPELELGALLRSVKR